MSPLRSLLSRAKKSPVLLARVGGGEGGGHRAFSFKLFRRDLSAVKKKGNVTGKHILKHLEELKRNTLQLEKLSEDVKRNTLQLETIAKEVGKNQDLINQLIDPDPTIEQGAQRFFYLASVGFLIGCFVLKPWKWKKKKTDEEEGSLRG